MRCRIHRGAAEVGGSCVELEQSGARLVLDLGMPLAAPVSAELVMPEVPGLDSPDPSLVGVVISHGHPDHYELATQLGRDVPLYVGAATERMLRAAAFFSLSGADLQPSGHLRDAERTFARLLSHL